MGSMSAMLTMLRRLQADVVNSSLICEARVDMGEKQIKLKLPALAGGKAEGKSREDSCCRGGPEG